MNSDQTSNTQATIIMTKEVLASGKLTPIREGLLFRKVFECVNWRTGKQYTMRETAEELGVDYARFRNHLMLAMPFGGSAITDEQRDRLLQAPPVSKSNPFRK